MSDEDREVTPIEALLAGVNRGEVAARDRLVELLLQELHVLARGMLAREHRRDILMQTTALVNEAYLKLFGAKPTAWENKAHFFAAAKRAMRELLIDAARRRKGTKRNSGQSLVTLGEWIPGAGDATVEILALDEALTRLARLDARQAEVVEYKCLLGLTNAETAEVLGVSLRTVVDDWTHAKAWLKVELAGGVHS
ncbi:MAG: ECF-type sigma factor [Acidobacteria bacterium]|jgi:RNA polymerase sigma factor (TIGR02999 family)|nr:ECF-type sigma factor [Acidobacteriota bacterium]